MERDEVTPEKVQQVAEVVEQPIEIREYRRGFYKCPICGWSGYSPLPLGVNSRVPLRRKTARGRSSKRDLVMGRD